MKRVLNKWQFVWEFGHSPMYNDLFTYQATIGACKFISFPDEGVRYGKANYKGFIWSWLYWFPIARGKKW